MYLASVLRSEEEAAVNKRGIHNDLSPLRVRRLCSGLDRPLSDGTPPAVYSVSSCESVALLRDISAAKSFGSRPSEVGCGSALDSPSTGEFFRDFERKDGSVSAMHDVDKSDIWPWCE